MATQQNLIAAIHSTLDSVVLKAKLFGNDLNGSAHLNEPDAVVGRFTRCLWKDDILRILLVYGARDDARW
ncbi:Uncharacterized protein HZ326_25739 [Fusarium oxysporum f. sp. albedinis]|nr:Uncharacterized protein HZ326_25739 [Fusarium oxysporum f. sp. albedinis]